MKRFTLVELLVIIAIIGVLATLLVSAMRIGRDKIEAAECAENMKAIGVAFYEHNSDYRSFPAVSAFKGIDDDAVAGHWWNAIGVYLGYDRLKLGKYPGAQMPEGNILSCQKAEELRDKGYYDDKGGIASWYSIVGYGMNKYMWSGQFPAKSTYAWGPKGTDFTAESYKPRPVMFKKPSDLQAITDARYTNAGSVLDLKFPDNQKRYYTFDRIRHAEGANVLFADGRVLWKEELYWTNKMNELTSGNLFWRDFTEYKGIRRSFE